MGIIFLLFDRNYFIVETILHGFQRLGVGNKNIEHLQHPPLWIGRHNQIRVAQPLNNIQCGFLPFLLFHKSVWSHDVSGSDFWPIINYPLICVMMEAWFPFEQKHCGSGSFKNGSGTIHFNWDPGVWLLLFVLLITMDSEHHGLAIAACFEITSRRRHKLSSG